MTDRILEVGAAGIEGMDAKYKVLTNNMVNSETPGFKKSDVVIKSFPTYLEEAKIRSSTEIPQVEGVQFDQTPGTLVRTGNKTDLSIGGNGFFVVDTPSGKAYTRDGRFTLDSDGRLLTVAGGYTVQGVGGIINIPTDSKIEFTPDGKVLIDGAVSNTIKVVTFKDPKKLSPINGSLYKAADGEEGNISDSPRIVSGYVEASNVNIIEETMNMVYLSHSYDMNTKIISNREAMLSRAIDIGRPAQ